MNANRICKDFLNETNYNKPLHFVLFSYIFYWLGVGVLLLLFSINNKMDWASVVEVDREYNAWIHRFILSINYLFTHSPSYLTHIDWLPIDSGIQKLARHGYLQNPQFRKRQTCQPRITVQNRMCCEQGKNKRWCPHRLLRKGQVSRRRQHLDLKA